MQKRFSLLCKKNSVISLSQYEAMTKKKDKARKATKKTKADEIISENKRIQDEESNRLAYPKVLLPNVTNGKHLIALAKEIDTPVIAQSREELEKRYKILYEKYEDVFYETQELENQKKSILLEVASIKKQQERLLEMLDAVKKEKGDRL